MPANIRNALFKSGKQFVGINEAAVLRLKHGLNLGCRECIKCVVVKDINQDKAFYCTKKRDFIPMDNTICESYKALKLEFLNGEVSVVGRKFTFLTEKKFSGAFGHLAYSPVTFYNEATYKRRLWVIARKYHQKWLNEQSSSSS